ncbi:MAG: hypothetical protein AB1846_17465 [Chloroflexota bacterium]
MLAAMIRTTISIPKILLEQAEEAARQLNISRNRLIGLAIESFISSHQNLVILDELNRVYSDEPDPDEKARLSKMRNHHRRIVGGEW